MEAVAVLAIVAGLFVLYKAARPHFVKIAPIFRPPQMSQALHLLSQEEKSRVILEQEAQGQTELATGTSLPTDMEKTDRDALKEAGVKFGPRADNPLFTYVVLPTGWYIDASDHSMWSYLMDDKGRRRASIFYKASFHDQRAFLRTERRFSVRYDYDRAEEMGEAVAKVLDVDKVIHLTDPIVITEENKFAVSGQASQLGWQWLNERFPRWEDASAYWGELDIFPFVEGY